MGRVPRSELRRKKALRLYAWAVVPKPESPLERLEPFECLRLCVDTSGNAKPRERAARGCTRDDITPIAWDIAPHLISRHMGRHADPQLRGRGNWRYPFEDPGDGCPGGWYRCAWIESVQRYQRRRTREGGRVFNRFYADTADRLVLEAVHYLESEQERCAVYCAEQEAEYLKRRR